LWRKDYVVIVNGVYRTDRLAPLLSAQSPRVKVVKLHGDLFHRFMAWTPDEMDTYVSDISERLKGALYGRDLLVVGTSLRDARIKELTLGVAENGGAVWFTNLRTAPDFFAQQQNVRAVLGPDCGFESLFTRLAVELGVMQEQTAQFMAVAEAAPEPQTTDDFIASVVSIVRQDGAPTCTGFVLANPRLVVVDAFPTRTVARNGKVKFTAGGKPFEAKILNPKVEYPFGPMFLEVPADLQVPGLRINSEPLSLGLSISVAVAAGERTGVSSGKVAGNQEKTIFIYPLGEVEHLIELEVATAPGSSGAPVVDGSFSVRGFIVAGSTDPKHPVSYMYPALRWASEAAQL
jgi:hypothetical protein